VLYTHFATIFKDVHEDHQNTCLDSEQNESMHAGAEAVMICTVRRRRGFQKTNEQLSHTYRRIREENAVGHSLSAGWLEGENKVAPVTGSPYVCRLLFVPCNASMLALLA